MHVHAQVQTSGHDCLKSVTLFRSASLPSHLPVALSLACIMLSVIVVSGHETRLCWCPWEEDSNGIKIAVVHARKCSFDIFFALQTACTNPHREATLALARQASKRTQASLRLVFVSHASRSCGVAGRHARPSTQAPTKATTHARKHARTDTHTRTQARIRTFINRVKAGQQLWQLPI